MIRCATALASIACAVCCGNVAEPRHVERERARVVEDASVVIDAAPIDAGPNRLDMLVLRHDRVAPGTREIAQREIDLKGMEAIALPAFEIDTCVRAAFDADAPTAITLENSKPMTLATVDAAQGMIGAAGPVCFRKGDVATFRFNGQSRLRIVVWASP